MNILVTGSNGQLGSELQSLSGAFQNDRFFFTDVDELDITKSDDVNSYLTENHIDVVINCAAYTAVDKAEEQPDLAQLINVEAVKILAKACSHHEAALIHISTDYVFDGRGHKPYVESDALNPVSVYARTKAEAEKMVNQYAAKAVIIRTSWLYSSYGNNFVKTMMKYGKERDELNVIFDQIGTPTYARDLAAAILKIISQLNDFQGIDTFHFSNEGVTSWYDFALEIMAMAGINCQINPIRTEAYPLPAARPYYSVLDKSKIKTTFAVQIPWWKDSLKECINKIMES